jgi:hypothetical protein
MLRKTPMKILKKKLKCERKRKQRREREKRRADKAGPGCTLSISCRISW